MTKLIVIEGSDLSGKSTIAKTVASQFNYRHEHEPTFSSTYADTINFSKLDAYQREFYFTIDRFKHQEILNKYNIILDRYRITGLTYAATFGPEALKMAQAVYGLPEFKKPNLTIFIDMLPDDAMQLNELRRNTESFNPKLDINILIKLRNNFYEQIEFACNNWDEDVIIHKPIFGDLNKTIKNVYNEINNYLAT